MYSLCTLGLLLVGATYVCGHCCLPNQFEFLQVVESKVFGWHYSPGIQMVQSYVSINLESKQASEYRKVTKDGQTYKIHIITDFGTSPPDSVKRYTITAPGPNQKCYVEENVPAMNLKYCLPDASKFMGEYSYGMSGQALKVDQYEIQSPNFTAVFVVHPFKTSNLTGEEISLCSPVSEFQTGNVGQVPFAEFSNTQKFSVGIKSANVFKIPAICYNNALKLTNPDWFRSPRLGKADLFV